jgi:hypothetical protein
MRRQVGQTGPPERHSPLPAIDSGELASALNPSCAYPNTDQLRPFNVSTIKTEN